MFDSQTTDLKLILNGFSQKRFSPFIQIWDFTSQTLKHALKIPYFASDTNKLKKGTSHYNNFDVFHDVFIITSWSDKPMLTFYNGLQDYQINCKFETENPVTLTCLSPDGLYLVLAFKSRFQIWKLNSGQMLCDLDYHYQEINVIKFTPNVTYLITSGQDNFTHIWHFASLIDLNLDQTINQEPLFSFNHNTMPVIDIHIICPTSNDWESRLYSISQDQKLYIYDLSQKEKLLCSLALSYKASKIICDPHESTIFIGSRNGDIHLHHINVLGSTQPFQDANENEHPIVLKGHKGCIIGLQILPYNDLYGAYTLVSGSSDAHIKIWDYKTGFCLKSFHTPYDHLLGFTITANIKPKKEQIAIGEKLLIPNDNNNTLSANLSSNNRINPKSKKHKSSFYNLPSFDESAKLYNTNNQKPQNSDLSSNISQDITRGKSNISSTNTKQFKRSNKQEISFWIKKSVFDNYKTNNAQNNASPEEKSLISGTFIVKSKNQMEEINKILYQMPNHDSLNEVEMNNAGDININKNDHSKIIEQLNEENVKLQEKNSKLYKLCMHNLIGKLNF